MRQPKKQLTNENLAKYFNDNFEMAIYAIKTAQRKVHEGEETNMHHILDQIRKTPPSPEEVMHHKSLPESITESEEDLSKAF